MNLHNASPEKVSPSGKRRRAVKHGRSTQTARGKESSASSQPDREGEPLSISQVYRLEERTIASLNALARMHALSGKLLDKEGLQPLLQEIMEAAVEIAGAQLGTLQLFEGESLRIVAHHGHRKPFLDFFESAESRASVCGEATRRGERVIVGDVEESSLFADTSSLRILRDAGVRAVQSTPIRCRKGTLLGILTTQWSSPYSPDEHDLWLLDLLVRQAADLIEHTRAEEELQTSEKKYRQLFESMSEGFLLIEPIFDGSGRAVSYRYLDSNQALASLTRLKPAEIIGKDVREVLPNIEPIWIESISRVAETGLPMRIERFIRDLDGWFDVYIYCPEPGKAALIYTNTTERRQAEDALRKGEAALRMAERASRAGSWDWDILSGKTLWTPELFELFGLDPAKDKASFETWKRIVHPDDEPSASARIDTALKKHAVLASEYRIVLSDGTLRWIYSAGEGIYDESGSPIRMLGICLDITAQKQTEEELKKSRNKYQALIETTNDFIWEMDSGGRYTYCSPQMKHLWGIAPEDMIGKTPFERMPLEDRDRALESFLSLTKSPRPFSGLESEADVGEGRRLHIESCGVPFFDDNGRLLGFRGLSRDITERKQAEDAVRRSEALAREHAEQLETILEAVPAIIWIAHDRECRKITGNRTAREFLKIQDGQVNLSKTGPEPHLLDHFSIFEDGRELLPEELPIQVVARTGKELRDHSIELRFDDGANRSLIGNVIPFFDTHQRESSGAIAAFVDVTERLQAEDALRDSEEALHRANAELEARVQARTSELAKRATQLRALAGELTLTEQRERRRLAKVLHDHLQQLLVGAKFRLTVLGRGGDDVTKQAIREIEHLLDDSIASSRSLTAELSPPILHEAGLRAGLEWLVRRMADTQGLFVELNAEQMDSLPEDLTILIFESVRELLFNVVKHAQARSACVSVRRIHESLQLTVSDQGTGFDPSHLPQAGEAGGGFGLFGIRERLELFGGTMDIQSAPGQGSRFVISVPVTMSSGAKSESGIAADVSHKTAGERFSIPFQGRKIRVLLADDHVVVRQGIANLLSKEPDIEVVGAAANGQEAVELAQKLLPDVILMDMNMPKLNGIEATRIICNKYTDIHIIGLSMFEEVERAQAMRDAGATRYISKSGPAEELIEAIHMSISRGGKNLSPKTPEQ